MPEETPTEELDQNALGTQSGVAGSAYLFNADAQAILEEAPTLDEGLNELQRVYAAERWDNPEAASKTASDYAQQLRFKFKEQGNYTPEEIGSMTSVRFSDIKGEGDDEYEKTLDQVNKWEAQNLERLNASLDPDEVIVRTKLQKSIKDTATELRRNLNVENRSTVGNAVKDLAFRALDGATGSLAKLAGLDGYRQWLKEGTDPSADDDLSSAIASGVGSLGGALVSGIVGGPVGAFTYLGATGAGEVKGRYKESLEATGDETLAAEAATIEGASQALQTVVGAKVFGAPAKVIGSKILGQATANKLAATTGARVASNAAAEGFAEGAGQIISNVAQSKGTDTYINPTEGLGVATVLGAVFGGVSGGISAKFDPKVKPDEAVLNGGKPPPKEVKVTGSVLDPVKTEQNLSRPINADPNVETPNSPAPTGDFVTSDGSAYTVSGNGTERTKLSTGEVFQPLDKTFFVDPETALKIAALKEGQTVDGKPVHVLTDGEDLYLKSEYLDDKLQPTLEPTGKRLVKVPASVTPTTGYHPVEVNRPKNGEGNTREYRSHIGREIKEVREVPETPGISNTSGDSVGAASIYDTKERKVAERIRLNEDIDEKIREAFIVGGDITDNTLGSSRYFPQSDIAVVNEAGRIIGQEGLESATRRYLSLADGDKPVTNQDVAIGTQLLDIYNKAAKKARAEGDIESYNKLTDLGIEVADVLERQGTLFGRGLRQFNVDADGEQVVSSTRVRLNREALINASKEEGVPLKEIKNLDRNEELLNTEIEKVQEEANRNADIIADSFDPEIQESSKLANEIEKEGDRRLKKYQAQEQIKIDNEVARIEKVENEADTLEEESLNKEESRYEEAKKEYDKAQERIKELETKEKEGAEKLKREEARSKELLNKLETAGKERAIKDREKEIKLAEETVRKLETSGKDVTQAKKGLEELKSKPIEEPQSKLSKEERKEYNRLKRLATRKVDVEPQSVLTSYEKKELENLKTHTPAAKEKLENSKPEIPEKVRVRIDKLRNFAKERKAAVDAKTSELKSTTRDNFLSKSEKANVVALKKRRDDARAQKAEAQKNRKSYLTDEQKKRIAELTKKKEKIQKIKKTVEAKKREAQSRLSPEDEQLLADSVDMLKTLPEGTTARKKVETAINDLKEKALPNSKKSNEWVHAYWLANILSDFRTHITNFIGNTTQLTSAPIGLLLTGHPKEASAMVRGSLGAIPEGLKKGLVALKTGKATLREDVKIDNESDLVNNGPPIVKNLGYFLRALKGSDQLFYTMAKEGQARARAERMAENRASRKGTNFKDELANILYNTDEHADASYAEAQTYADKLKEKGIEMSPEEIQFTAWELLEKKRPWNVRETSTRFAGAETYNQTPKGFIGHIVRNLSRGTDAPITIAGKTVKPLKFLLPFLNIGGNLANASLDFFPITGAYRALNKTELKPSDNLFKRDKRRIKDVTQRQLEAGRALMGGALMGSLWMLSQMWKDDEDPWFDIIGAGPSDKNKRAELAQKGVPPWSIKIGDKYIKFSSSPLVVALGSIAAIRDMQKYDKHFADKGLGQMFTMSMLASLDAFADNSFLRNLGTLIESVKSGTGGVDKVEETLRGVTANTAKGFIPGVGFWKMLNSLVADPINTKGSTWAKFIEGLPFAQEIGTDKRYNVFGEPIEQSFFDRYFKNKTDDPEFNWLTNNGYNIKDTGGFTVDLGEAGKGVPLKVAAARKRALGSAHETVLTPEERVEFIKAVGPEIREIVKKYRERYGNSGHREAVQDKLDAEIAKARSKVKYNLFLTKVHFED